MTSRFGNEAFPLTCPPFATVILSGVWRVLCAKRSRKPALSAAEGDLLLDADLCNELLRHHTKAVLQFLCGVSDLFQGGFFLRKQPLSFCGFALHQLENRVRYFESHPTAD